MRNRLFAVLTLLVLALALLMLAYPYYMPSYRQLQIELEAERLQTSWQQGGEGAKFSFGEAHQLDNGQKRESALLQQGELAGLSPEEQLKKLQAFNAEQRQRPGAYIEDPFGSLQGEERAQGLDSEFALLELPDLDLRLPVYLDATRSHLDKGAAQIRGTSLPVGGLSTHCVLAGHSGMRDRSLFSRLKDLPEESVIRLLNPFGELYYLIDHRKIILPTEVQYLQVEEGKDKLSLLTCDYSTPGVVNRLMLFGERLPEGDERILAAFPDYRPSFAIPPVVPKAVSFWEQSTQTEQSTFLGLSSRAWRLLRQLMCWLLLFLILLAGLACWLLVRPSVQEKEGAEVEQAEIGENVESGDLSREESSSSCNQ